jgi:hypothetical protein
MPAQKIDGNQIAKSVRERIHAEIQETKAKNPKFAPSLAIIQVGERSDSTSYVNMKSKAAQEASIAFQHIKLPEDITEAAVCFSNGETGADSSFCPKSTNSTTTSRYMAFLSSCRSLVTYLSTPSPVLSPLPKMSTDSVHQTLVSLPRRAASQTLSLAHQKVSWFCCKSLVTT